MVHGILQFTPSIAFRYVLHRCKSRDIRCRESFGYTCHNTTRTSTVSEPTGGALNDFDFLGAFGAGVLLICQVATAEERRLPTQGGPRCKTHLAAPG